MATIQKLDRKSGVRWRALVRREGYVLTKVFPKKTEARAWAETAEARIRMGKMDAFQSARGKTLGQLLDAYERTLSIESQRPKSLADIRRHLGYWRNKLGLLALTHVTAARVAEGKTELASGRTNRGRVRSPATVNRYLTSLSGAFHYGIRELEWTDQNPVRNVSKLKEPKGRDRVLSGRERKRLLFACQESGDRRLYPLTVLALSTAARQGELVSLRWENVDLAARTIRLEDTKNREPRTVPLRGHALEVLRQLFASRQLGSEPVFARKDGCAVFPLHAWERARQEARIPDVTFHDLRHSAATELAKSGASLLELQQVLGHRTLQMVLRYAHLTGEHTGAIVEKMNRSVFGETGAS